MTLREMAYERDPRIAAERVQELYEKELRKLAKKEGYEKRQKELLDRQEARESVKKQAEDAKLAEAQKISDDKKAAQKLYRESVKKLTEICVNKMPGTKYDKFYVEVLVKKYPTQPQIDELIKKVENIKSKNKNIDDVVS